MIAGRLFSPLSGKTVTIFMPMWRPACQAGMSSRVAVEAPLISMSWWWRTGTSMSRRKAWRRRSTRLG
jgi:hypothetical protein